MFQFTDLHLAISNKLGWGDMLAEIAMPAIEQIINNYKRIEKEFLTSLFDKVFSFDRLLEIDDADIIFSYLYTQCVYDAIDPELFHEFISLRNEIEDYMRRGVGFQTAINELFK